MDKTCVTIKLHAMIDARLFGGRPWLADRGTCEVVDKQLHDLGLQAWISEDTKTVTSTQLGKELDWELILVFLGIADEAEVPGILADYGLLSEAEVRRLLARLDHGGNGECILLPILQKAFFKHYNPCAA